MIAFGIVSAVTLWLGVRTARKAAKRRATDAPLSVVLSAPLPPLHAPQPLHRWTGSRGGM